MMRRLFGLILLSFLFTLSHLQAQIVTPVKWSMDKKQVDDKHYDLIFTAKTDPGWYIYSQYLESDDGPVRTSFNYDEGDHFSTVGKNKEEGAGKKEGFDKMFEMNVTKYTGVVTFTQRMAISDFSKELTGYLTYMTCDDSRCLAPTDVDFNFKFDKPTKASDKDTGDTGTAGESESTASNQNTDNLKEENKTGKTALTSKDKAADKEEAKSKKENQEADSANADEEPETTGEEEKSGIVDPVKWAMSLMENADKSYDLIIKASLEKDWSIYSQHTSADGPFPTEFSFDESDHFSLEGEMKEEGNRKEGPDPVFDGINVIKFVDGTVTFTQKIKSSDPAKDITGFLTFMACDKEKCLPPSDVSFKANLAKGLALMGEAAEESEENTAEASGPDIGLPLPDLNNPVSQCGEAKVTALTKESSYWTIFLLGMLGGFVALLTPCVFPMIPLTVAFFTKSSKTRQKGIANGVLYGFFIFAVYVLLSIPFHLVEGINADILNNISTNTVLNLVFFAVFIFFAFSFFGYYEITLPSSWSNKSSSAEGVGGVLGIFFMAITLALVSFSCTGPILGALLAGSLTSDGGAMQLSMGMGGFGLALALPFALFAAFPGWMNTLPKSGGWLTTVKVVIGFFELALAFKFLSNADLVNEWGMLTIEPFLAIWILCALGLGIYLFGKLKFPHDPPKVSLSFLRVSSGILALAFAVYLMSGFRYNEKTDTFTSLTLLSGLAPPVGYSWLYPKQCPNNLDCFNDIESALTYSQKVQKPIMIDFTGKACVNCRKMEEHVWPDRKILPYLEDEFVLVSLYVDYRKALPEEEQITVNKVSGGTRKLRTYGDKWSHFQTEYFQTNTQPQYVLLSPEGKLLNKPVAYTPDVDEYENFLSCGLDAFKKMQGEEELLGNK